MEKWERIKYYPCKPLGKGGKLITGSKEHIKLARQICYDGIVLLKNDNNVLPIAKDKKVVLLSKGNADYVSGGGGAGSVESAYVTNLIDGMRENRVDIFEPLAKFYEKNVENQHKNRCWPGHTEEPEIPKDLLNKAKKFSDTCIVSLCRKTWETFDVKTDKSRPNAYYLTTMEEKMLDTATSNFKNVVLVLNIGSLIDPSYFANNDKLSSIILGYQGGMEGGRALADIICGKVNPSGKLTDTYAKLNDYPSTATYHESEKYVEYTEDIYVGYRYFETVSGAKNKICFPFGFGLSYTTFDIKVDAFSSNEKSIILNVTVKNTGKMSGKEVVEVYSSLSNSKIQRPELELRAYKKTKLMKPDEEQKITLKFQINDLSYYNENRASYVLEKGDYNILFGNSSVSLALGGVFNVSENRVIRQLKNRCVPLSLSKQLLSDNTYKMLITKETEEKEKFENYPDVTSMTRGKWYDHILLDTRGIPAKEGNIKLIDVANGKNTIDELLDQLTLDEMITLLGGCPNMGVANTAGIGGIDTHEIPAVMTADGPAGLRLRPELDEKTTAFPCATLIACTFDDKLAEKFGKALALETKENNFGVLLAPALNIHRNPLCGRNFEYFSEDPYVSGKMAAAIVKGIQSVGISACIKHFACNNKEGSREISDSVVSERALREIYLRGFEIAIRESKPYMIMTAYNKVNGRYTSENKDLIDGILRKEWGFDGLVTTDWDNRAEPIREVKAGNNLRMPAGSNNRIKMAVNDGVISKNEIRESAKRVLQMILKLD